MVKNTPQQTENETTVRAIAPSNIALIKYWGKSDATLNWPANDSISMTLSRARTITSATIRSNAPSENCHRLSFRTSATKSIAVRDQEKTTRFLEWLRLEIKPYGSAEGALDLLTYNSFPSSCGIASSASGFAALTVAATAAWTGTKNFADLHDLGISRAHLSDWARRGSGSACRSIHGGFVQWERGHSPNTQKINPVFSEEHWPLADLIVLIDRGAKSTSSTEGHARAFTSPLMNVRLSGLGERLKNCAQAIEARDLERLGTIIEAESIEMHAVMMTSNPRTDYFGSATIDFISWLRKSRAKGEFSAWFTLDAGPNPHVLCRPEDAAAIKAIILKKFPSSSVIHDQTGSGALLESEQDFGEFISGGFDGH